jgi:hypothetical protein
MMAFNKYHESPSPFYICGKNIDGRPHGSQGSHRNCHYRRQWISFFYTMTPLVTSYLLFFLNTLFFFTGVGLAVIQRLCFEIEKAPCNNIKTSSLAVFCLCRDVKKAEKAFEALYSQLWKKYGQETLHRFMLRTIYCDLTDSVSIQSAAQSILAQ